MGDAAGVAHFRFHHALPCWRKTFIPLMMTHEFMPPEPTFSDADIAAIFEEVLSRRESGCATECERVAPYELVQKLGEGGFGVVWMALQHEPLQCEVALKLIKPGIDSEEVVARFQREQRVLARLDHPGIARVFDAGLTADDRPFIVMERVDGVPITAWCHTHEPDLKARVGLVRQICAALQHAHEKGIIHRDLKPSNLLVMGDADTACVKIIDFGIARALHPDGTRGHTWATRSQRLVGTPAYMSPEQTLLNGIVDTRTDLYAVGVLLHELLTGIPLVPADLSLEEKIRQVQEAQVVPPSQIKGVTKLKLPTDLDWITLKCLEKEPERRYPGVDELDADLDCWLKGMPVRAHPPSRSYRLARWTKRHRGLAFAAMVLVSAILLGTGMTWWQAQQAQQRLDEANAIQAAMMQSLEKTISTELGHRPRAYDLAKDVLAGIRAGMFSGSPDSLRPILDAGAKAAEAAGDEDTARWARTRASELP